MPATQPVVLTEREQHSLCVVGDGNWDKNGKSNNSIVTSSSTFLITVQYLCLIIYLFLCGRLSVSVYLCVCLCREGVMPE